MTKIMVLAGSDTHFKNSMEKKLCSDLKENFKLEKIEFEDAETIDIPENLEKIEEKIQDSEKVFLVGYCLGGTLALLLRTHEKIQGIVAMDPPKGIIDNNGKRFSVDKIYSKEPVLLIGSEQAQEGLPETDSRKEILKTSHSFRGKAEEVSELVKDWITERTEEYGREADIHG